MQIKVSIIIPVFNVENYLEECLLSAVSQDYENKEVIIIDDGSTDSSRSIIDIYKDKYSCIKSINTKNQGQSLARNIGLEIATGDYVLFLDSDDWIQQHTVSLCVKTISQHNLDIVLFGAKAFFDGEPNGEAELDKLYSRSSSLNSKIMTSSNYFVEEIRLNNYIVQPCLYMFNRVMYKNLRFYKGIVHEDNLFTTELLLNNQTAKVMPLPDKLYHRRYRKESTMTQKKQQHHISGYFVVIDELVKILPKYKKELKNVLKQLITNLLFEVLLILNPIYGWHIPFKVRWKIMLIYLKYGLLPFNFKLFAKFMMPGSFSFWKTLKRGNSHPTN